MFFLYIFYINILLTPQPINYSTTSFFSSITFFIFLLAVFISSLFYIIVFFVLLFIFSKYRIFLQFNKQRKKDFYLISLMIFEIWYWSWYWYWYWCYCKVFACIWLLTVCRLLFHSMEVKDWRSGGGGIHQWNETSWKITNQ